MLFTMLTMFTTCAPFRGHRKIIQTNALRSWTLLRPRPEILLFGDEEGTTEIAQELGIRHIPQVERNEYGTPLGDDLFRQAERLATHSILCFSNADMIFTQDFMNAIHTLSSLRKPFVFTGPRLPVQVHSFIDFSQPGWDADLLAMAKKFGPDLDAVDFIVFPKGLEHNIPPMAVGRIWRLGWIIWRARLLKIPVVDGGALVPAFHQDHPYERGAKWVWEGPEAQKNLELTKKMYVEFITLDATHILTQQGIRPAIGLKYLWRRFYTLPVFYPWLRPVYGPLYFALRTSRPLRLRLRLTLSTLL
ncbi:MAG: hypothetical protein RMK40_04550 [Chloroflexota bacterium]|nr:hypothetical protein [Chloroflexota bacterium]